MASFHAPFKSAFSRQAKKKTSHRKLASKSRRPLLAETLEGRWMLDATIITDNNSYYPNSNNTLAAQAFNESETIAPPNGNPTFPPVGSTVNLQTGTIGIFYTDETPMTLGVTQATVNGQIYTGTVSPMNSDPGDVVNPLVGVGGGGASSSYKYVPPTNLNTLPIQAGTDPSGRPLFPSLYVTDITGLDPNSVAAHAGDWQFGGTPQSPNAVFGAWTSATETISGTSFSFTKGPAPAKNGWNIGPGADPAPTSIQNQGYGAEAQWTLGSVVDQNGNHLIPGHSYRFYFIVHDGDQNKVGGDVGQAAFDLISPIITNPKITTTPGTVTTSPGPSSLSGVVYYDVNADRTQEAGEPGLPGVTVTLTGTDTHGNAVNETTTTNALGQYSFIGLTPSSLTGYTVTEAQPAGYIHETQVPGSTGGTTGDHTITTVLPANTQSVGNDFAELLPSLTIVKTADVGTVQAGQPITYTYVVTNGGPTTLTGVTVTDDDGIANNPNPVTVGTIASLAPGSSQTFTRTVTAPTTVPAGTTTVNECQVINGTTVPIGTLTTTILPSGDVKVVFNQSLGIVDNTYGTSTSAGWGSQSHKFSDLLGSDAAEFQFFANGSTSPVLDFQADYVQSVSSMTLPNGTSVNYPSGYGTAGLSGDGKLISGNGSFIKSIDTTITDDLNQSPAFYGYTTNSPAPSDPNFANWNPVDGYAVVISKDAFGASGFGGVKIVYVHDSPSKIPGTIKFTPTPCDFNVTNTATVTATAAGAVVSAADQATVDDYLSGMNGSAPQVTVTTTADNSSITAGSTAGYTVAVSNIGASAASGITFTDPLPGGDINWTIASQSTNGTFAIMGTQGNQTLVFTPNALAAGTSDTVHFTGVTTANDFGALTNTAVVTSANEPTAFQSAQSKAIIQVASTTTSFTPAASIALGSGEKLADSAVLSGAFNPTGTITFTLYSPTGTLVDTETVTVNGNGTYITPNGYLPTVAGTYQWVAVYSGDAVNPSVSSNLGDEPEVVTPFAPTITTVPGGPVVLGSGDKLTDTATLAAASNPGGTITFYLFAPGVTPNGSYSNNVYSDTVTVSGNGSYNTSTGNNPGGYLPTALGQYEWVAVYSGDSKNHSATSNYGDEPEQVVPSPTPPSITTTPGGTVVLGNAKLSDSATLSGGTNPTGTITFYLFAPGPTPNVVYTDTVAVTGNGTYSTNAGTNPGGYLPTVLGTYQWVALYSGDAMNSPATSRFGDEPEIVVSPPAISTFEGGTLHLGSGGKLYDSAQLQGGVNPTGTITFYLFAPGVTPDATDSNNIYSDTVTIDPTKPYDLYDVTMGNNPGGPVPTQTGTYQWVAVYSGDAGNPPSASQFGDEPQTVVETAVPDVDVLKTADSPAINAGQTAGFTVTVFNEGTGSATGVTLSDPLPAGFGGDINWTIDTSGTGAGSGTVPADFQITGPVGHQVLSLLPTITALDAGASLSVHVTGLTGLNDVDPSLPPCSTELINTATVNATNEPAAEQNEHATATITLHNAEVDITKTADQTTILVGGTAGFTVDLINSGCITATGLTLTDPLPGGLGGDINWQIDTSGTGLGAGTTPAAFVITGTVGHQVLSLAPSSATLAAGATLAVHITGQTSLNDVNENVVPCQAILVNTATVSATNEPSFAQNASATAQITINCGQVDVDVTKTADAAAINAGQTAGFTVKIQNEGADAATGVTLSDPLPAGVAGDINWTIDTSGTGNGAGTQPSSFQITGPIGHQVLTLVPGVTTLAGGAALSVHITGLTSLNDVDPNLPPCTTTLVNTVTVNAANELPFEQNEQSTASILLHNVDLDISKTPDQTTIIAGGTAGFTVNIYNEGCITATGVTLDDPLPAGLGNDIFWQIDTSQTGLGANTSPQLFQIIGGLGQQYLVLAPGVTTLAAGANMTVHITGQTSFSDVNEFAQPCHGILINTATANATNEPSFAQYATATAQITINCGQVDVDVTKTADQVAIDAGQTAGFTIKVTNEGTDTATGVTLTDPLPAGVNGDINWVIDTSGTGFGAGTNPADFQITGPAGHQVLSLLPSVTTLAGGASLSVHITGLTSLNDVDPNLAPCTTTLVNTATVNAANELPSEQNEQATASIVLHNALVQIFKTADQATITAGDTAGFTVRLFNDGCITASGLTLNDALPGGLGNDINWQIDTSQTGLGANTSPQDFQIVGTVGHQQLVLAPGITTLAAQTHITVHITGVTSINDVNENVQPCQGILVNTATASATNEPSFAQNAMATATVTINCGNVDVDVTKTADQPSINAGQTAGFTVTLQNEGTNTATGVTLSDPLPGGVGADIHWVIDTSGTGLGAGTQPADFQITGPVGHQVLSLLPSVTTLAGGASLSVHITGLTSLNDVDPNLAPCTTTLVNTATVNAANELPSEQNEQATASIVLHNALVQIFKTADQATITAGDTAGFTVRLFNDGCITASGLTLNDALPGGLGNDINWQIDTSQTGLGANTSPQDFQIVGTAGHKQLVLAPGITTLAAQTHITVHITGVTTDNDVNENVVPCQGTIVNTATASAANEPSFAQNATASATITINCPSEQTQVVVFKVADQAQIDAGQTAGFTIKILNEGANTATGLTLNDALPAGVAGDVNWQIDASGAGFGAGTNPSDFSITGAVGHQVLSLASSISTLAAGASISVHVTGQTSLNDVDPNLPPCTTTLVNTATVNAANEPANEQNAQATATVTLHNVDVDVSKTADQTQVVAGQMAGFTIQVYNQGCVDAEGLTLNDRLSAGAGNDIFWRIDPTQGSPEYFQIVGQIGSQVLEFSSRVIDLQPGTLISVHIIGQTSNYDVGTINNTVTVSASNEPSFEDNAHASATINIVQNTQNNATALYVQAAFEQTMYRAPDQASLQAFVNALNSGAMSRSTFAMTLLHSTEYYNDVVSQAYEHFLGRTPDAQGLQYWSQQLANGLTDEQLEAQFIGSAEYYQVSGNTDKAWVDHMYFDLLGRTPDNQGENYWVQSLANGASRSAVALGFAASAEREGEHVKEDYEIFLGRLPAQSEIDSWVAAFESGMTNEDVIAGFIAAPEYYNRHS